MDRIEEFWKAYLRQTSQSESMAYAEVFSFGHGEQMADCLLQLVLQGKKTATCWRHKTGEEITQDGAKSIVLDGQGNPVCIIETVETIILPYKEVDWTLAKLEGEDEDLESWKWNHKTFFEEEGKRKGFSFDENMLLCFEKFKVVYNSVLSVF